MQMANVRHTQHKREEGYKTEYAAELVAPELPFCPVR